MADWNIVIIERPWKGPAKAGHYVPERPWIGPARAGRGSRTRGASLPPWLQCGLVALLMTAVAACATHTRGSVPPGTDEPDKFLFDKGTEALNAKKWLTAREFFKQVTETYTASPYRPDAKLGIGDTYLGEGTAEALVLAINEFREFLSFYPTNKRADYAQYKVGLAHFRQMRGAQRDQTETREAVKELQSFLDRYPGSSLLPEVQQKLRESRDRLSESDYLVGYFYFRQRWYPGAIVRFKDLLKGDPGFTGRDAVFFYLGESLVKTKKQAEALPYFERLINEFEKSEYLPETQKRVDELKKLADTKSSGD